MTKADDIRRKLAGAIGKPVRDDVWDQLVEDLYVQEVIDGQDGAFSCLKKKYLKLNERFSSIAPKKPPEKHEIPPDNRLLALADILAIEAATWPEVVSFREEILNGQLLAQSDIAAWIKSHADEEGGGAVTLRVSVPLAPGEDVSLSEEITLERLASLKYIVADKTAKFPEAGLSVEVLGYPELFSGEWRKSVAVVNRDTVLDRLRTLAKRLAAPFGWAEAQAVGFILSGATPALQKARGSIELRGNGQHRVKLNLDPRLSSQEVAKFYVKVRRQIFTGRDRPMSDKHLFLAVFLAGQNSGTWKQKMEAWNETKKEWAYSDWRIFARDASFAWKRVTGRKRAEEDG